MWKEDEWRRDGSPCICPIINSLSRLSAPARSSSLAVRHERNLLDRPVNQPASCTPRELGERVSGQPHVTRWRATHGGRLKILTSPVLFRRGEIRAPDEGKLKRRGRGGRVVSQERRDRDASRLEVVERLGADAVDIVAREGQRRCRERGARSPREDPLPLDGVLH